jgi:hypothetical protein
LFIAFKSLSLNLRQVGGFTPVPSTNKTDRHDLNEILLKLALNTISQTALGGGGMTRNIVANR